MKILLWKQLLSAIRTLSTTSHNTAYCRLDLVNRKWILLLFSYLWIKLRLKWKNFKFFY